MIAPNHHSTVIDENLTKLVKDMDCMGDVEVVEALQKVISRSAMVIAKKTNPDHAQVCLYKPYLVLSNKISQGMKDGH